MKKIFVIGALIILLGLLINPTLNANILELKNKSQNNDNIELTNTIEYPINAATWNVGNSWIYDMNLAFHALNGGDDTTLKVEGTVPQMYCRVKEITSMDSEQVYVLSIDDYFTGTVNLFGMFDIGHLENVRFSGEAYINANSLAPQKFFFELDGKIGIPILGEADFFFTLEMSFKPSFNFFGFPIESGENSWNVDALASLTAYVKIKLLGVINYETTYSPDSMDFDDTITNMGLETISVKGKNYETVKLSGIYGDPSSLYYSPEVGFLAKVYEDLIWGEDGNIKALFDLKLVDTNFILGNDPPKKPTTPSGPSSGNINEKYNYVARTIDPEGDKVKFLFDWGDGSETDWTNSVNSGSECVNSHTWVQKGIYNVIVCAKDESGIVSEWSDPFTVTIGYDQPMITIKIHRIVQTEGIDIAYPWDENSLPPEFYYKVSAETPDLSFISSEYNHNTESGDYETDGSKWDSTLDWQPNKAHELLVKNREVLIKIKVMDFDDPILEAGDDLADVSGCNHPDGDGVNDNVPEKRGAIFHSIYDMGSTDTYALSAPSPDHNDYSDYWEINNGYYHISGDDPPDSTTDEEPLFSPQNDAKVWFSVYDNYKLPKINAEADIPKNLRPGGNVQFRGIVTEGATPFSWSWNFGDGSTSNEQNPLHSYSKTGNFKVTLTLTDSLNQKSTDSFYVTVYSNSAPENLRIIGPNSGQYGTDYTYVFKADDPEEDVLSYKVEWGDGTGTGWMKDIKSGEEKAIDHKWSSEKTYTIKFTVEDEYGAEKSTTLSVSMPRNKQVVTSYIYKFFNRFPLLQRLLNL